MNYFHSLLPQLTSPLPILLPYSLLPSLTKPNYNCNFLLPVYPQTPATTVGSELVPVQHNNNLFPDTSWPLSTRQTRTSSPGHISRVRHHLRAYPRYSLAHFRVTWEMTHPVTTRLVPGLGLDSGLPCSVLQMLHTLQEAPVPLVVQPLLELEDL